MRNLILGLSTALCLLSGGEAVARQGAQPWESLRATAPLPPVKETGRLKVEGAELHYAVYGEGHPVILLHPGLGNSEYWANQVGPLSQDFRVITVDLRGHGRSTGGSAPLTYRLLAEDVVRLIKTRKLKEPAIVGWGDGAVVGLEIARHYPKRIGKLVAFGLTFDKSGQQPAPDKAGTFVDYVRKAQADYQKIAPDPAAFGATLDGLEAMWEREPAFTAEELAKVKVPTVVMAAEYDEWVKPQHMTEASRLIPGAQLVLLPRASHFAPWQASKKFNDALRLVLRE
ncbi:MAG TPA: alpha/beta hydrolase [Caulobacteraceae bacterium]|nr:alpha/beta hydrolase [Caulobacteraceae bacterium]